MSKTFEIIPFANPLVLRDSAEQCGTLAARLARTLAGHWPDIRGTFAGHSPDIGGTLAGRSGISAGQEIVPRKQSRQRGWKNERGARYFGRFALCLTAGYASSNCVIASANVSACGASSSFRMFMYATCRSA